ncbi:MAG: glycosyltransferase family 1 protein, partial [Gemmatimonadota bacterium]|nr:glycosyltransferase family 1 protein [Gemmatimonadota bacterium]
MPPAAPPLRVALFTDTHLPQLNGVTRTLDRLERAIRARGGSVRVWAPEDPRGDPAPHVRAIRAVPFWAYPELRIALPHAGRIVREAAAWGATVVHAATPFGAGLAGRRAARTLGLPLVTSYHTSFSAYARFYHLGPLARPGWRYLRWFHNGGLRTYAPSEATAAELRARGFRGVRVWTRGVETDRFSPAHHSEALRERLGVTAGRMLVGNVGRMAREKGLDTMLAAMHLLERDAPGRFVFAFAGDGPYLEPLRREAPPSARFMGRLEGEALSVFYASLDLFVFPSVTDTFGNVLLEAMASGAPVLAADAAPTRALVTPGRGLLYYPGAGANLAAGIRAAFADRQALSAMRARALTFAAQQGWDRIFD